MLPEAFLTRLKAQLGDEFDDYLRSLDLSQCREIHLLHLSDATSHEGHFLNKVARAVPKGIEITACEK